MCEVKQSKKKAPVEVLKYYVIFVLLASVLSPAFSFTENVIATDSYEPDNNPGQASTISVDGTLQSHDFDPAGEEDWLKFTAVSGKFYIIETHNLANDADTYLYLYDTDGTTLLEEDDDGGFEDWASKIAWIATGDGDFYVMCEDAYSSGGSYDINISESDPPPMDIFEPDNSPAQATPISADGSLQNHSFHISGDQDWLNFTAVNNTVYLIETHNLTDANTGVVLFDSDGATLIAANDDGGVGLASKIIWKAPRDGHFYVVAVEVNGSAGETYTYDINISITVEPPGDAFEPDDEIGDANVISTDGSIQNHSFHISGDEDWLMFSAISQTMYAIETHNLQGTDTYIYIYDSDGTTILEEDDNGGVGSGSYIFWTAPRDDTFYIRARDYYGSAGSDCTYEINLSETLPPQGDIYEPDDTYSEATPILTDGVLQSHTFHLSGDVDWINFTAVEGNIYIIETHNLGDSDTEISLYDSDGTSLLEYDDEGGVGSASRIEWTALASGDHYVCVEEFWDESGPGYTYDINVSLMFVPEPPNAPGNLTAIFGDSYVNLTWVTPSASGTSSITNYLIYRNTSSGAKDLLVEIGNQTYYNDTTVTNYLTYYYEVCAKSSDGEGEGSNECSAIPYLLPSSPTSLSAKSGEDFINISWNPPASDGGSAITNYTIYRRSLFSRTPIATVENATFYNDTDISMFFTYYYSVSANNIGGEGSLSDEIDAKIIFPPGSPLLITVSIGQNFCLLNWSEPFSSGGSSITNYRIYRSTVSGEEVFLEEIDNSTSYNDTSLTIGVTYYYKISAKNIAGEGDLSFEISVKLGTLPGAPTNVKAVGATFMGVSVISLTWVPPEDTGGIPITNYKIYRGTSSGDLAFLDDTGNITLYYDTTITSGKKYYYKVVAENDMGVGVSSAESSTSPKVVTRPSILPLLVLIAIIAVVIVVIVVVMLLRKKRGKKQAEEAQIGFEGGAWDGQQQGYMEGQAPGYQPLQDGASPSPVFDKAQQVLTYKCPHCQEKFSADSPSQNLIVACPNCNGQSVIGPQ